MREYVQKPENKSRTLDSNPRAFRQVPISEILQSYRDRTFGKPVQRQSADEDELLQGKFDAAQRETIDEEELPAQLNALAHAQGTDIHVASGQEKHLPHEAWHVVQQKQGRVEPNMHIQGININDGLEKEANIIGEKAIQMKNEVTSYLINSNINKEYKVIQAKLQQWRPNTISNDTENQLLTIANTISDAVDIAFNEFISGNYNGASQEQILLYTMRKSEYDEYKKTGKPYSMHPSTSAGYVIEGKVNAKISSIPNIDTQAVGLLDGSRPDIVIHTGIEGEGGNEILGLVDITAEKSVGHIFRKSGNWTKHKNIIFVAEVYYPSINFDTMAEIVLTDEQKQQIDSIAEIRAFQIKEYNEIRFNDFEEKGSSLLQKIIAKHFFVLPAQTPRTSQAFVNKLELFGFEGSYPDILYNPLRPKKFDDLYPTDSHGKTSYNLFNSNEVFKLLTKRIETENFFGRITI